MRIKIFGSTLFRLTAYSKSKLELESNLGEILPVHSKFIRCSQTLVLDVRLLVQKRKIQIQAKIFLHHSSSTFFEFSSSLRLEYGR